LNDWSQDGQRRRLALLEQQGHRFSYATGEKRIGDPAIFQGNIENFIGTALLPIGVIGPLRVNGLYAHGDFYVPMATVEGALVASHNRGAMVISLSGGASVMCLTERLARAPGFVFRDLAEAGRFAAWALEQYDVFREIARTTSRHGKLEDVRITIEGNHVYLNFEYTTGDASGQNMVTIATQAICEHISATCPIKARCWFVESNLSGDKKATAMSYLFVRGKKVTAEVIVPRRLVTLCLHTTPEMIVKQWEISFIGGAQSGSIGIHGHYANALAALFIAIGQDAACVAEASVGITRAEITDKQDLYVSVTLPNLIVGTVGGATSLPTQSECLRLLGCEGEGKAKKFAELCAATVLAGEISIGGALAAGEFTKAHMTYGRRRTR
jgi:hydroxymethylglutaryl-CoA reductase (NADPH)